jgi:hypothetical protein
LVPDDFPTDLAWVEPFLTAGYAAAMLVGRPRTQDRRRRGTCLTDNRRRVT